MKVYVVKLWYGYFNHDSGFYKEDGFNVGAYTSLEEATGVRDNILLLRELYEKEIKDYLYRGDELKESIWAEIDTLELFSDKSENRKYEVSIGEKIVETFSTKELAESVKKSLLRVYPKWDCNVIDLEGGKNE